MERQRAWAVYTERQICRLHPLIQDRARVFMMKASEQGLQLAVTSGFRNFEEQRELYMRGRVTLGSIVTNADAGESWHNFGLAIDVVEIVGGQLDWDCNWNKIAQIGKSLGFKWGGWKCLKDKPHFEEDFGYSLRDARQLYLDGKTQNGYIILG